LDAYKIFYNYLDTHNPIISNNFDVDISKFEMIKNIRLGLEYNTLLLRNIFNSFINDVKFIFYRTFNKQQLGYNKDTNFMNLSMIKHDNNVLDDNFNLVLPDTNVTNLMNTIVRDSVSNFNSKNRDIFTDEKFKEYFDYLKLWGKININTINQTYGDIINITTNIDVDNMYFLNYIPIITNQDIPVVIRDVIERIKNDNPIMASSIEIFENNLYDKFDDKKNIIHDKIVEVLGAIHDSDIVDALDGFKRNSSYNGDIMMMSILRQNYIVMNNNTGEYEILPDYVLNEYLKILDEFDHINTEELATVKLELEKAINLFRTSKDNMPDFGTFKNTLYYNLRDDLIINSPIKTYSDVISSIWYNIFREFVENYNSLYNDSLLNISLYNEKLGKNISSSLKDIMKILELQKESSTNYYIEMSKTDNRNKLNVNGDVYKYIKSTLDTYKKQLDHYDNNKKYLNIPYSSSNNITQNQYLFEKYKSIIDGMKDSLKLEEDVPDNVKNIFDKLLEEKRCNVMDIMEKINNEFNHFIGSKDQYKNMKKHNYFKKYDANKFYKMLTEIKTNYNRFKLEEDVYRLLIDKLIEGEFDDDLVILKRESIKENDSVESINESLIEYLQEKLYGNQERSRVLIDKKEKIIDVLEKSLKSGERANFAWIQKLGHYLIDRIGFSIGDQIMDVQYGEWLQIWHSLTKRNQKERGYKILIGDVPELTTFNTMKKPKYQLMIPLQFWFCRYPGSALPLVALHHTEIEVFVKLKELEEVSYFDACTRFRKKPKLDGRILAEYIYVETEERNIIAKSKHEHLVETLQFSDYIEFNKDNIREDDYCINVQLYFKNPVKEIVWFLQRVDFIDGSQENCERKYHNYGFDFETGDINPINKAKIQFEGRDREHFKDIVFYNFIQPYDRHYSDPDTGINLYIYSLDPESYQPKGAVNLSRIDNKNIVMTLKPGIFEEIKEKNLRLRFGAYGYGYNIVRIMSGLAGLSFYS
jgi:hypothetical protein